MAANLDHNVKDTEIIHKEIEYKELNIEDFWNEEESVGLKTTKTILDLQDTEYLSDVINSKNIVDYNESNTVVINSSVGQGKSTLAIDIAKKFYLTYDDNNNPLYSVIFAVPHKSLVKQYIKDMEEILLKEQVDVNIPDYANLVEIDNETTSSQIIKEVEKSSSERLHVFTINCLLGNPGDDAVEQGFVKRSYLDKIISINKNTNRKIVIILDEIHDSIHNFKQDLIFNLWKFRTKSVLHKTFILSATFNEASKVVIKYIAELTHKKLQIIESKRKQQVSKLSNLHIHLTKGYTYDFDSNELVELLAPIIEKHQVLNILSYSKRLCSRLVDGTEGVRIRDLLTSKFGENINICIPEQDHLTDRQKKNKGIPDEITYSSNYIQGKCNIGTTFKTGVSIKEKNSGYVIILPPKYSMQGFVKSGDFGIFTNGIISLIQALARTREKSDIYVIMPYPKQFIQYNYIEGSYIENLLRISILKNYIYTNNEPTFSYHSYQDQNKLMSIHYDKIKKRLDAEIKEVEDLKDRKEREFLPYLKYPTLDMYILSKGEKMLHSYYIMFGKDLSAYMIWGAFNNQFVNCKLKTISTTKEKIIVKPDNIQHFISEYLLNNCNINWYDTKESDVTLYEKLYGRIKSEIKILVKKKKIDEYRELSDIILRRHIMAFLQKFTKGNHAFSQKYMKTIEINNDTQFEDLEFSAGDYLLCSISCAKIYDIQNILTPNTETNHLIDAYLNLYEVYQLFINNSKMIMKTDEGKSYIYPTYNKYETPIFTQDETSFIIQTIKSIAEDDNFKTFRKFQKNLGDTASAINAIYKELREAFFYLTKDKINTPSGRININYIEVKDIPTNRTGVNLLYEYDFTPEENYENDDDYNKVFVDWHEINQPKWEDADNDPTDEEKALSSRLKESLEKDGYITEAENDGISNAQNQVKITSKEGIKQSLYNERKPTDADIELSAQLMKLFGNQNNEDSKQES
ncbi:hypothetical protein D0T53_13250 [Dysgonomonas sp. 216]|uniref:DEAD/DEAH box helicase family protein n=1 Tax=Dysgonomonas sp. 216 TaxID=2302934 RepID=UPI0013D5A6DF|nr:DEAD/DEAH box helicase family protein [Dysgonomonas sp. 216]NDW19865.1 hypothetical protein [Dysgonomonas sp. 216]